MADDQQGITIQSQDAASSQRFWNILAIAMVLVGLAFSLTMAFVSDGLYQDDDCCHYLFAVHSWGKATTMWHQWGRPGYNIPAMLAAKIGGFTGCRIFSSLQTALTALLAWRIAVRAGVSLRAAAFVPIFLWIQPMVMGLSYTTLTETPTMLYLTAAVLLYMRGNPFWSCVLMGLCFITRQETMALAPVLGIGIIVNSLRKHNWKIIPSIRTLEFWSPFVMIWAVLVHIIAALCVGLYGDASPLNIFASNYTKEYGHGEIYHYLLVWPEAAASLGVLLLATAGLFSLSRKGWIVWAITLWMFIVQSLLFWKGMFASGGYGRFMVSVSGLVAVLAGGGLGALWRGKNEWLVFLPMAILPFWSLLLLTKSPWLLPMVQARDVYKALAMLTIPPAVVGLILSRGKLHLIGKWAAIILLVLSAGQAMTQIRPWMLTNRNEPHHILLSQAADYIKKSPYAKNPIMSQHTVAGYLLGPDVVGLGGNQPAIDAWKYAKPGSVFIWESKYCVKNMSKEEKDSTLHLYDLLFGCGEMIWEKSTPYAAVKVFVKKSPEEIESYGKLEDGDEGESAQTKSASQN